MGGKWSNVLRNDVVGPGVCIEVGVVDATSGSSYTTGVVFDLVNSTPRFTSVLLLGSFSSRSPGVLRDLFLRLDQKYPRFEALLPATEFAKERLLPSEAN